MCFVFTCSQCDYVAQTPTAISFTYFKTEVYGWIKGFYKTHAHIEIVL